ncbi:hypothetical protein [Geobacter sp. DSM 9736]|uniref:hypothetical protein n=1 Tax=Geobacter sp. DSM 9736 TaxID=1277350 RepID=UPI000B5131B8|nr:hypothetical protein [Geobacter sp. DSM 9736]SNB45610.1 hypothetical protein SAMN06269301_1035 [Geobacter sp. DSM 9736]
MFKSFFGKNFKHYLEKGDKYREAERYADARHAYLDALEKLDGCEDRAAAEAQIRVRLSETGDLLGRLNLQEAEFALKQGDLHRAGESLSLVLELAEDKELRDKAAVLMMRVERVPARQERPEKNHVHHAGCAGCAPAPGQAESQGGENEGLAADDRFLFLIQTLPDPLPGRYASMGEKFARAYLAAHEGNTELGMQLYREQLAEQENDILLYEMAILDYRNGHLDQAERFLLRALDLNAQNELCHLGIVQLLIEKGRAAEAVPRLRHMIDHGLFSEQAIIMLGDVYQLLGDEAKAMETLSTALAVKGIAKAAAERLIPLLEGQNRREEAAYLAKNFLKGCC